MRAPMVLGLMAWDADRAVTFSVAEKRVCEAMEGVQRDRESAHVKVRASFVADYQHASQSLRKMLACHLRARPPHIMDALMLESTSPASCIQRPRPVPPPLEERQATRHS
jgi:hypothetical protein